MRKPQPPIPCGSGGNYGTVYFLRCPSNGLTKIGFTAYDPMRRLRDISSNSPIPLEMIATMAGSMDDERKLHDIHWRSWSHGEWFKETESLNLYILENAKPWTRGKPPEKRRPNSVVARFFEEREREEKIIKS